MEHSHHLQYRLALLRINNNNMQKKKHCTEWCVLSSFKRCDSYFQLRSFGGSHSRYCRRRRRRMNIYYYKKQANINNGHRASFLCANLPCPELSRDGGGVRNDDDNADNAGLASSLNEDLKLRLVNYMRRYKTNQWYRSASTATTRRLIGEARRTGGSGILLSTHAGRSNAKKKSWYGDDG
jgi:hypothetical protein